MDEWITGLLCDPGAAERAIAGLQQAGFKLNNISVMMSASTRVRNFTMQTSSKAAESATAGEFVGGAVGAVVAGLTATGSVAALGTAGAQAGAIVAGPLAAALAGLGAGALSGGVVSALAGLGMPEIIGKEIEKNLNDGGIVIAVHAVEADAKKARAILADAQRDGGEHA